MLNRKILKVLKKILKILGYIIGGVLLLVILILLLLQTPPAQNFVKNEALKFYRKKVDTRAELEKFRLKFPNDLILEGLYLEDQQQDTLAYVERLRVAADMWKLFSGELPISAIELNGFVGKLDVDPQDSTFNFNHIAEAFAPADTAAVDTTSQSGGGLAIDIDAVYIDNSRFYFDDPTSGIRMMYSIGNFDVELSQFNLDEMIFHISDVALADSYGEVIQTADVPSSEEESEQVDMDIDVGDVTIDDVRFFFESIPGEIKLLTNVGSLTGTVNEIDINEMNYFAEELHLANTLVDIDIYGKSTSDTTEIDNDQSPDTIILNAGAKRATFSNTNFQFDDHTAPETEGFDPMHFGFEDIDAEFEEVKYRLEGEDSYAYGTLNSLNTREEAGMTLSTLQGTVEFTPTHTSAKNFEVAAGKSRIAGDFRISYPSLDAMAESPGTLGLGIDLNTAKINLNDVAYFLPDLDSQFNALPPSAKSFTMEGEFQGKLSALDIRYFQLKGLSNTSINLSGYLRGIPEVNNLYVNLNLKNFQTTRSDINALLPDTLLPENITIPQKLSVSGTAKGGLDQADANLSITTTMGNADIEAKLNMLEDSVYAYEGNIIVDQFDVGKLIQQEETMGALSMNIEVDGKGFTPDELNTKIVGQVQSFGYNNYTYNELDINGEIFKREFSGNLSMDDENLDFDFEGTVDLNDSIPAFMFFLDIENVDLNALNFMQTDLRLQGEIDSDLRARDLNQIRGHVRLDDFTFYQNDEKYTLDSLLFRSRQDNGETLLTIDSDLLDAEFRGSFSVVQLPKVIQAHVNQYYHLLDTTSLEGIEPQSFEFNIDIKETELFTDIFVPDLDTLETGVIKGMYDSDGWIMDIEINVPKIVYAGIGLDSLGISLESDESALTYEAGLAQLNPGVVPIENILFEGVVANNHINTALHIMDDQNEDKFLIGGIFTTWEEEYYQLQLTPGRVILGYDDWDVYPGNSIRFFPSGSTIEDLRLTRNNQKLSAETNINDAQDTILNLGFNNFHLETFNELAALDTAIIGGLLNGSLEINNSAETFAFTSDVSIRHLAYEQDTLGNLSINAYTTESDRYNLTASLDGRGNNLLVEGFYEADSTNANINFDVDMESLKFTVVEAFTMGNLSQSRGYLTGDIDIRGTVTNPDVKGFIGFKEVRTVVNYSNTFLRIDDERIEVDLKGVHFDNFTIEDGSRNDFTINGDILTDSFNKFRFDLNAQMRDFLIMNTGAGDNPLVYGTLIVDSDISVEGDSDLPVINMDINLNDDSRVTYIVPESEISTIEREGLIEFVDKSEQDSVEMGLSEGERMAQDTLESALQGFSLTANIDIEPSNKFTVVIDPATGDRLDKLQGEASLAMNINPTGDISLNGRYTVNDGKYILKFFGLARREFLIQEGSYILWTGEPLNAQIDITALYNVLASPQPLFNNVTLSSANQYQKRDFSVLLNLDGRILQPEISFDIQLAEEEDQIPAIAGRLREISNQESIMLEEVLSLVVFRRFSGGNILSGGGGGGAEATARQSVSRLLSQQLNQLGSQVQGVDISFDVQSYQDYSQTGQSYNRTDVELGVSKQFFDNRVIVNVAGNINVEGQQQEQRNLSDFAGDISIEYLITEDGRFRLLGFRKNQYDDLLQGEVIETGVGLIFVKDYNTLSELFSDLNGE